MSLAALLGLLGAVVAFILWGSTAGKGEAQVKSVSDAFDALGEFNCQTIKDPVDFATFMAKMKDVYDNCNAAGSSCSGKDVCRKMTLKFNNAMAGDYYMIDKEVLGGGAGMTSDDAKLWLPIRGDVQKPSYI